MGLDVTIVLRWEVLKEQHRQKWRSLERCTLYICQCLRVLRVKRLTS